MVDWLASIDEVLKSKVGLDPSQNKFMQGDNFQDLENNPEAKAKFQQGVNDKMDAFNVKLTEIINPSMAATFDSLAMKKLREKLPTMETIDEVATDGDLIEKIQAYSVAPVRATTDAMNWLFEDAARVYRNRQDKLDQGVSMEKILEEEDPMDSLISVIGPAEWIGGLGVKFLKGLSDKYGPAILSVIAKKSEKINEVIGEKDQVASPDTKEKITMEDLELFSDRNAMPLAFGGSPGEEGQFSDSIDMTGMKGDDVDVKEIINQPGFMGMDELDIFEEAKKQGLQ